MNPSLTIRNAGRRLDVVYVGVIIVFLIFWAAVIAILTSLVFSDFGALVILWLVFFVVTFFGALYSFVLYLRPLRFEATSEALMIFESKSVKKAVRISRGKVIRLHFGHLTEDEEPESVVTLNLFVGRSPSARRVMISPYSHVREKREIFGELRSFLTANGFRLEVEDDHPRTRGEDDAIDHAGVT